MIASLNHPHICTLHDVGHHGDMDYLVMEFLEGKTLASRLSKGMTCLANHRPSGISHFKISAICLKQRKQRRSVCG